MSSGDDSEEEPAPAACSTFKLPATALRREQTVTVEAILPARLSLNQDVDASSTCVLYIAENEKSCNKV
jgi:hypothetical protein